MALIDRSIIWSHQHAAGAKGTAPLSVASSRLLERIYCALERCRRFATGFDKLTRNFLGVIALAS